MEPSVSEQYQDLGITQNKDGDYWDIVIPDLDFETDYALQAAWVYSDKTKGISEYSDRFNFTTEQQEGLLSPRFISDDLYAENSILYINWNGKDSSGSDYLDSVLKQVNIWIKGGDFGTEFVQYGTSFTKAGTIQINATKKSTYCVKLQAESKLGKFSLFSNSFCVTMLKQPKMVYDIRHQWDNLGNLTMFWKFDPTFKDDVNDNTMADSFGIQLLDTANDTDATWWTPVEQSKIPPLEQKIVISVNQLQKVFGQSTAFEIDYDTFIYVRDKNLQTSLVAGYLLTKYSDPLTAPVISAIKAPMAYNVSYTANSLFDKIYIEESTNSGATWTNVGVTSSNPAYIATTNSLARSVRAKFSKKLGGFTDYSNVVSVTPDKIDPTDTTPPTNPTNVSATAVVDSNDKTGFSLQATISFTKSNDADCRGYRVRWTTQTEDQVYEYGYVDHPSAGTTVSFTISGLIPNTTYYYQVASVDQFNNTQSYTTAGTFIAQDSTATAEGSLARLKSYISIGGTTGDLFKFGTGILDSINTSITTTPNLSDAPITGYHGILLNKTGNKNNYWLTTGQIRVGTDTQFMYFDGTDLYLTGDINARSGKITGNLTMTGGGSVIAKTTSGALNKVTLSHLGLFAYDAAGTETTQIISNAAVGSPTFTTVKALIGNWTVGSNTISAGGVTLNSLGSIIATNSGSYVGIKPRTTAGTDVVLWAGNTETPAANSAASGQAGFQVNANGQLYATGAIISGVVTLESGSSLGGLVPDSSKVYYSGSTPTVPTGGHKTGDAWVDTANGNRISIWSGTAWVIAQDSEAAKAIAENKTKTTYGPTQPTNSILGDVWYDTNTGVNYFKVYNGTQWVRMKDSDITDAQEKALAAQASADSKAQTTYGTSAPSSPKSGDLWFDTNFSYFKRYNGTQWERIKDGDLTAAQAAIIAAQGDASTALQKAAAFGVDGSLVSSLGVKLNNGGSIYSTYTQGPTTFAKTSYSSTTPGYFIGWENQAGVIYPAFNVGNDAAYIKYSNYTQTLSISGNIATATGDYWNRDGSFRFGGSTGITKDATGSITIGSNTIIQGSITASSLNTTYTDIDTSGNLTIINGTKTTSLSSNATLTMSDSSTGWDAGGAISVSSKSSGYYGTEDSTLSMGGNRIQLSRSGGTPSASYQSYIGHADELSGVSRGTFMLWSNSNIAINPSSGLGSGTVLINGRLNPFYGIAANTTIYGSTTWDGKAIRNITVNASAPSGGAEGDIWIQI